ncbi:fibronectin type III domain-containing protein [Flavobacterium sediminilitoris]|uniref:Fibronectin type III domain-containing protein n=1 Tax=Flavobacterium sediminilitoris TaxID=2024526 RepID=A0ABY4HLS9_9FLAO|nr:MULTISPECIES: fibronectin type III domain-containing protein [Flavobacterium]UOX33808.1 fibronectin type III domain-containing protein [Flavobacterium sediminilitoris]
MKNFLLFLSLTICNLVSSQTLYPYLQNATPTSIYINWKTSNNSETIVEYGTDSSSLTVTVTGNTNILTDVGYPGNYYYHSAKLTNLNPNTKYYYKIKTGSDVSDVYSFKTLPNPGEAATADGHIRFLIMGDNQLKNEPRYDSLVSAAKRKIKEKWGATLSPDDNISMTFMVGDQVDVGTLDHYEHVHFKKNRELSGYLPIQTTVGNHETYGTLGMNSYYSHFFMSELSYQGISSNSENYYAQQAGNVLFISMSSEHTGTDQLNWIQQVLTAADSDSTVDWIFSLSHRPYQAEQYVGDISNWVRETAVPLLTTSDKYIMHVGAHHHLYHRGQLKNTPTYNIISGGTAWDQYWSMSTEKDFEDVQKTISNWMYQIVDIDVINGKMDIESYSIGSIYKWKNNQLMDKFHRYKNKTKPNKPSITNTFSTPIELPITLDGSAFSTNEPELLNTSQFVISKFPDFNVIEKESYRDFENLFGKYATQRDSTVDVNLGVDITKMEILSNSIDNGIYYAKLRYRDQNLEWSDWSDAVSFEVINSNIGETSLSIDSPTNTYNVNQTINVNYINAPAASNTWIGIYKDGQTPGGVGSQIWQYTNGTSSGTINFSSGLATSGRYYVALFINDGYTEVAERVYFYVGDIPVLSTDETEYAIGSDVVVSFSNAPNLSNDWIGIYKMGIDAGDAPSTTWEYVTSTNGSLTFNNLPKGYYYAAYYLQGGFNAIGNKAFFKVGDIVTELWINKPVYELGEQINASWTDAPGIVKDWLGIYNENDDPNIQPLISYQYFEGLANGNAEIESQNMPTEEGNYFIVMFTNDSYDEVSNRVTFEIVSPLKNEGFKIDNGIKLYPNPTNNNKQTFIQCDYPIDAIELFNTEGQLLYATKNVNNNKYSLLTQDLPKGVYIIKIHSRKLFTAKLIVE